MLTKFTFKQFILLSFIAQVIFGFGFISKLDRNGDNYDVKYYKLNLKFMPDKGEISGKVLIEGIANENLSKISLDLVDTMKVDGVLLNNKNMDFSHIDSKIIISTNPNIKSGEKFKVIISYHGNPGKPGFIFIRHDNLPAIFNYGIPYSAHQWWPCKDTPADKVDSADINYTIPSTITLVSNGVLRGKTQNGDGTTTYNWKVSYPIYPDVISIAATDYKEFNLIYDSPLSNKKMPLNFYVFPEDLETAKIDFAIIPEIMSFYANTFGEYPFIKEKYGLAEFSIRSFREHQTIPSIGSQMINGNNSEKIIAHDLAHQWFGNSVSVNSWKDIWLNEGFASYAQWLWFEHSKRKVSLDNLLKAYSKIKYQGTVIVSDSTNIKQLFSLNTFIKGPYILHMLRYVVGDKIFFEAMKDYLSKYRYKNSSTALFEKQFEQAYGKDLSWFFNEWLHLPGKPSYTYKWNKTEKDGEKFINLEIAQVGEIVYKMPLTIQLNYDGGKSEIVQIMNDSKVMNYNLPVKSYPSNVIIDPDNWVLKTISEKQ